MKKHFEEQFEEELTFDEEEDNAKIHSFSSFATKVQMRRQSSASKQLFAHVHASSRTLKIKQHGDPSISQSQQISQAPEVTLPPASLTLASSVSRFNMEDKDMTQNSLNSHKTSQNHRDSSKRVIYKQFRPLDIILRNEARQLFIIQSIKGRKKMIMKMSLKLSFRGGHPMRGDSQIQNFRRLSHSYLPILKEVLSEGNRNYLIFDYIEGITLLQFIEKNEISQELGKLIIEKVLEFLEYLHSNRMVHRDIRPDSILVSNFKEDPFKLKIHIIDMGLVISERQLQQSHKHCQGSEYNASPESVHGVVNQKFDIWSVGILAIFLLSKFSSLDVSLDEFCQSLQSKSSFYQQYIKNVPEGAISFINCLLASNHTRRPTASQALKHSWFSDKQETVIASRRGNRRENKQPFIENR